MIARNYTIFFFKDKLKQIEIFNVFLNSSANQNLSWIDVVECFSFQAWLDNLTSQHTVSKFAFEEQKKQTFKSG